MTTPAHDQKVSRGYILHFPAHEPRRKDGHYRDFQAYRRKHVKTAKCAFAERTGDTTECRGGLELHHSHIEFAMANSVDLALLERDYPGVSNPDEVGAWIETGDNLTFYCSFHHRGAGGVHCATSADFEAEHYIRNLISD